MQVELLDQRASFEGGKITIQKIGDVVDVSDGDGKRMIASGRAKEHKSSTRKPA